MFLALEVEVRGQRSHAKGQSGKPLTGCSCSRRCYSLTGSSCDELGLYSLHYGSDVLKSGGLVEQRKAARDVSLGFNFWTG